jgi:hypothetical protein
MKSLKAILLFYCLNLVLVVTIWTLFGTEVKFMLNSSRTYFLPLLITFIGLLFGLGIPHLLYDPDRKAIFLWSQLISTVLFCSLIIKVGSDKIDAQNEYQLRKNKPENVIHEY